MTTPAPYIVQDHPICAPVFDNRQPGGCAMPASARHFSVYLPAKAKNFRNRLHEVCHRPTFGARQLAE